MSRANAVFSGDISSSPVEIQVNTTPDVNTFLVSVVDGGSATGSFTVGVRTYNDLVLGIKSVVEDVIDPTTSQPVTVQLGSSTTVLIDRYDIDTVVITPSGVSGSFKVVIKPSIYT